MDENRQKAVEVLEGLIDAISNRPDLGAWEINIHVGSSTITFHGQLAFNREEQTE